jgi:predicted dehydrogenase
MSESPPQGPVRVAVWGLGIHSRNKILPALASSSSTTIAGVTSRDAAVTAQEAARFACRAWATPEEMLSSDDVDAVYVATPPALHYPQGKRVLAAGKHLWCEKPLAARAAEAAELVALARHRRRSVCEAFMYLYHPQFRRLLEIVEARQKLGRVCSITCRFGMPFLERPSFRNSAELGGGALLDVACYPLSLARHVLSGDPDVRVSVVRRAPGLEVDSDGHALLDFGAGTVAYLEWGFGRAYVNEVRIWGELGSLYADRIFSKANDYGSTICIDDLRGVRTTEAIEPANAYIRMLDVFALATRDENLKERLREEAADQARNLEALTVS